MTSHSDEPLGVAGLTRKEEHEATAREADSMTRLRFDELVRANFDVQIVWYTRQRLIAALWEVVHATGAGGQDALEAYCRWLEVLDSAH
jgi:hypothetical protein